MRDTVLLAVVVITFAIVITCHVTLAVGLARRYSVGRGALAFIVPPLAPYWGLKAHMWIRSVAWLLGVFVYGGARLLH